MLGDLHQSNLVIVARMFFGIVGTGFAYTGSYEYALISLMISAVMNVYAFDIAGQFQQDDRQLSFGIELEVLADFVSFGLLPACLLLSVNQANIWSIIGFAVYLLAVAIRLAHFNRPADYQDVDYDDQNQYLGLPLLAVAPVLPVVFLLSYVLPLNIFAWILIAIMIVLAAAYVIAKPIPMLRKDYMTYTVFGTIAMIVIYILLSIFVTK